MPPPDEMLLLSYKISRSGRVKISVECEHPVDIGFGCLGPVERAPDGGNAAWAVVPNPSHRHNPQKY
jgi:hypothetical protein